MIIVQNDNKGRHYVLKIYTNGQLVQENNEYTNGRSCDVHAIKYQQPWR